MDPLTRKLQVKLRSPKGFMNEIMAAPELSEQTPCADEDHVKWLNTVENGSKRTLSLQHEE